MQLSQKAAEVLAAQAAKGSGKLLGPLSAVFTGASLAKNPWHVARTRASMTGAVLADAIVRADLRSVVLVGFSLGARVMIAAAESLATRAGEDPRIESMHLLGAAVGTRRDWHSIEPAVDGTIRNYYSTNDKVLSALYRVAEGGTKAIGCEGIPTTSREGEERQRFPSGACPPRPPDSCHAGLNGEITRRSTCTRRCG